MKKDKFWKHSTLCPLPWSGIYVDPSGQVRNCAISNELIGVIQESPLPDILTNDINLQIKKDMLNEVKNKRCNACYNVENNASDKTENESNRTWYKKIAIKKADFFEEFDNPNFFTPMVLDLRWRNTCNQACVYCGPDLSSLWADSLNLNYSIEDEPLEKSKSWIIENISLVKHVYLAGGEPLLIKENKILLETLLEKNPDVEIRVNTNLSKIETPVFKLLTKFENVKWTISVDSQKEYFEYMRWPAKWNPFVKNLKLLKNLVNDQINFNMVWCILNDIDIIDTIDFLLCEGYHENMFIVQCLTEPFPLDVRNLPLEHKQRLQEKILKRQELSNPNWWLHKSLSSMYNFLNSKIPENNIKSLYQNTIHLYPKLEGTFKYLDFVDNLHKTDSSKIFTELYKLK